MIRYLPILILAGCATKPPAPVSVTPPVAETPVTPRPARVPKQPVQNIFFSVDVDTLKSGQLRSLTTFRNWYEKAGGEVTCTGYADTTGTTEYNLALSLRRAEAVAAHIPCRPVGAGETGRWGAPQHNRRVTIEVKADTTKKK